MPKLYSGKKIIKSSAKLNFEIVSQKGSHIKLRKTENGKTSTVIVPNHKEIAIGTMGSILKQANISKEELEKNI